jgi:hypothetical protein
MPKDVKKDWMDEALPDLEAPAEAAPAKSLDEIDLERQQASDEAVLNPPPPMPVEPAMPANPLPKPDPISDKDLAKLLEDSAKALLDAAHSIDKSNTNLKKILAKLNYSGDKEVQVKVDTIIDGMTEMMDRVQAMSDAITEYRQNKISEEPTI